MNKARWELEREASRAWLDLHEVLIKDEPIPLEWALRWSRDGTLRTLWSSTSGWMCHQIATALHDPSDPHDRLEYYRRNRRAPLGEKLAGKWIRRKTPAPTIDELRLKLGRFSTVFDMPF